MAESSNSPQLRPLGVSGSYKPGLESQIRPDHDYRFVKFIPVIFGSSKAVNVLVLNHSVFSSE